ncbi:MAG TPA: hypothetical protein VMB22_04900 [Verrucomicrobiae bacterium]|nr:hypothetical protein [Verrucomicrobiae bacterium]
MNDAEIKIKMINGSFRCLFFGLVGLLPVAGILFALMAMASQADSPDSFFRPSPFFNLCLGVSLFSLAGFPFAVTALVLSLKARASEKRFWNAARTFRIVGNNCASLGIIFTVITTGFLFYLITNINTNAY